MIVHTANGNVFIDSSVLYGHVDIESRVVYIQGARDSRIANSTFYDDVHWVDTLYEIRETVNALDSTLPGGSGSNHYYGNAYFKGKVHLGIMDTSLFHGNLTIEAMDGSVLHRARLVGDNDAALSISNSAIPFKWLGIDKSGTGSVSLSTPVHISDTLTLYNGKVYTQRDSYVRLLTGSITQNAGAQGYVAGEVQKEGNTPFVFPVGSESSYKPFSISAPADPTDLISVQYHAASPTGVTDTTQRTPGLQAIGNCEYWEVQQPQGNNIVTAALMWDAPCMDTAVYMANTAQAQIAQWDGSIWNSAGNSGYANGYITTTGTVIPQGLFTFASAKKAVVAPEPPVALPPMVIYPNPAQQYIHVYTTQGYKKGIITDAIGRRISIHDVQPGLNTINVSYLPAGIYFLKLITTTKQRVLKWVKM